MNATDQAKSPERLSKIATILGIFKNTFPKAQEDLTPWSREFVEINNIEWSNFEEFYRNSIDMGFKLYKGTMSVSIFLDETMSMFSSIQVDYWHDKEITWQYFFALESVEGNTATYDRFCEGSVPKFYLDKLDDISVTISKLYNS